MTSRLIDYHVTKLQKIFYLSIDISNNLTFGGICNAAQR